MFWALVIHIGYSTPCCIAVSIALPSSWTFLRLRRMCSNRLVYRSSLESYSFGVKYFLLSKLDIER